MAARTQTHTRNVATHKHTASCIRLHTEERTPVHVVYNVSCAWRRVCIRVCTCAIGPVLTNSLITSPCLVIDAPVPANYQQQSIMAPESANTIVLLRPGPTFAHHPFPPSMLPDRTAHPSSSRLSTPELSKLRRATSVLGCDLLHRRTQQSDERELRMLRIEVKRWRRAMEEVKASEGWIHRLPG